MPIVINVPRDERFGDIGRGLGAGIVQGQKAARMRTLLTDAGINVPEGASSDEMELAVKLAAARRKTETRAGKVDPATGKISGVADFTQEQISTQGLTPLDEARFNIQRATKETQIDRDRADLVKNNPHLADIPPHEQRTVARNIQTGFPKEQRAFEKTFSDFATAGEKEFKIGAFDTALTDKLRGSSERSPTLSIRDAVKAAKEDVDKLWEANRPTAIPLPEEEETGFDFQEMLGRVGEFFNPEDSAAVAGDVATKEIAPAQPDVPTQETFSARAQEQFGVPIQPDDVAIGDLADTGVPITLPRNIAQAIFDGDADIGDGASYLINVFDISPEVAFAMIKQNRAKLNTVQQ